MEFNLDFQNKDSDASYENLYLSKNLDTTTETESEYVDSLILKLVSEESHTDLSNLIFGLKEMDLRVLMRRLRNENLINKKNSNNFAEIISSIAERLCISYKNLSKKENNSFNSFNLHLDSMNSYLKESISEIYINQDNVENIFPIIKRMIDSYLMLFENYPEDASKLFKAFSGVLTIGNKNDVFEKILDLKKNRDILVSSLPKEFYIQKIHNLGPNGTLELLDILNNFQEENDKYSSSMVFFFNNVYTSIFNKKNDWEEDFDESTVVKNEDLKAVKNFENKLGYSYFLNYFTQSIENEMERSMKKNLESEIFGGNQIEPFEIQPGVEVILLGDQIFQKTNKISKNDSITDYSRKYDPEYSYVEFKDRIRNLKDSIDNNSELERYKGVKMHRFGNVAYGGEFIEIDPRDTEKLELEYQAKLFFDKQIEFKKILGNLNEEQVREYILFLSPIIRKKIEAELNVKIKDFSYRKQIYILNMLKDTSVSDFSRVKSFSKDYGYAGFNTFLSIEQGGG